MRPNRPNLEQLEDRCCPSPAIFDHGGPVIPHPALDELYIAGSSNEDGLAGAIARDYLRVLSPYGVGAGSVHGSAVAPGLGPLVSDYAQPGGLSELQTVLLWEMLSGQLPLPTLSPLGVSQDIYVIHLAPGEHVLSPQGQWDVGVFAGYHGTMFVGGVAVPYAVVLDQGGADKNGEVMSHEVAEAATDPVILGLPDHAIGTGYTTGWPGWEIGDVYAWEPWVLDGYVVQTLAGPDLERIDSLSQ